MTEIETETETETEMETETVTESESERGRESGVGSLLMARGGYLCRKYVTILVRPVYD